jgi:prepilin-type N-terminal cleavage/methylation domain-containing protein
MEVILLLAILLAGFLAGVLTSLSVCLLTIRKNNQQAIKDRSSGFTLIEIVVSTTIFGLLAFGLLALFGG